MIEENLFRFDQFRMLVWEGIRNVLWPVIEISELRAARLIFMDCEAKFEFSIGGKLENY